MSDLIVAPISPVFRHFAISSTALAFKMSLMSFLTSRKKIQKSIISNPEDRCLRTGSVKLDDDDVLRIQRAHRNDLENISLFFVVGAFYTMTKPCEKVALGCFYSFTAARYLHSFSYVNGVNPWRSVSYLFGMGINVYMMIKVFNHFLFTLQ